MFKKPKQQRIFSKLSDLNGETREDDSRHPRGAQETIPPHPPEICRHEPGQPHEAVVPRPALHDDPLAHAPFVFIAPGTFFMGSPEEEFGRYADEPLHRVTLTQGFFLQTTPVTQRQWKAVMGANPSSFPDRALERPVDGVSWHDCQDFIRRLNAVGKHRYRLPTEAEWEYACRAGSSTAFCNGDITPSEAQLDPALDAVGWYRLNSDGTPQPVARKTPNAWGLYDMHGNLCEWCEDWYGPYPQGHVMDPVNTRAGDGRVCRGGSWASGAANCRSAARFCFSPDCRSDFVGFRLVRIG